MINRRLLLPALLSVICLVQTALAPRTRALSLDGLRGKGYGAVPLLVVGRNVLAVDVEINGKRERLVVDTGYGGGGVLLHDSIATELNLPNSELHAVNDSLTAAHGTKIGGLRGARAQRMRMGNVELTDVPLYFVGVRSSFRGRGGKGEGDGFIGAPFLISCGAVIDLQNAVMYLHAPGRGGGVDLGPALRAAGMVETPLEYRQGSGFLVNTQLAGVNARMLVDTGAGLTTIDPARVQGLKAARWNSRLVGMDAGGHQEHGEFVLLRELRIGDHNLRTTDVRFSSLTVGEGKDAPAGLLGPDLLGRNGAIINCGTRQLYLIPNNG